MSHQFDPKLEKNIHDLRKTLDSMTMIILGAVIVPVIWLVTFFLSPLYAFQRKKILEHPEVVSWLNENEHQDLKLLSKEKSTEGSIARIKQGGILLWLPVIIPLIAFVFVGIAVLVMRYL